MALFSHRLTQSVACSACKERGEVGRRAMSFAAHFLAVRNGVCRFAHTVDSACPQAPVVVSRDDVGLLHVTQDHPSIEEALRQEHFGAEVRLSPAGRPCAGNGVRDM